MTRWSLWAAILFLVAAFLIPAVNGPMAAGAGTVDPGSSRIPVYSAHIVKRYPHDSAAFTQGLIVSGNVLHESTGRYGTSTVRRVDLATGKILKKSELPLKFFGEGLTLLDGLLYQLTWRSGRGFMYKKDNLEPAGEFSYSGEGWGLTTDGSWLIMSDGSADIRFINPFGFREMNRIRVMAGNRPVDQLNELEYIDGEIWANVWKTDRIARIDPSSGRVTGWIDCQSAAKDAHRYAGADVTNGIAYDAESKRIFITGKNWPALYEITIQK